MVICMNRLTVYSDGLSSWPPNGQCVLCATSKKTLARMPATDADADFLITSNALRRPEPELQWPKLPTDNKIPFI